MFLSPHEFYHIYNRGNNKQPIFFSEANYFLFLKKIREQLSPVADVIAWCLMPNHFHLIIHGNEHSIKERSSFGGKSMQVFAYRLGILLSSYAQAINKQNKTSGSLFQQKTKCKMLSEENNGSKVSYLENCFFYLMANPVEANLVKHPAEWPFSCFSDYAGLRNGTLCKKELFFSATGLSSETIKGWRDWGMDEGLIGKIF